MRRPVGGEYGVNDLFIGVPVIIGANGVEKVIELQLTSDERAAFDQSIDSVEKLITEIKALAR